MVELNNPTVSDNTESGALNMVKLTIDNCEVVVPEHTTILDAAKSAGKAIGDGAEKAFDAVKGIFGGDEEKKK